MKKKNIKTLLIVKSFTSLKTYECPLVCMRAILSYLSVSQGNLCITNKFNSQSDRENNDTVTSWSVIQTPFAFCEL